LEFDRVALSVVKCPKCQYSGKVADYIEKDPAPKTEVNHKVGKFYKPGKLELIESDAEWLSSDKKVDLLCGINTLGRKSPNSTATIQLPTTDTFMSREHATIEVVQRADGIYEHRLWDDRSRNSTLHNGVAIEKGDVIVLMPGDTVKLGRTIFNLELS